jgi:hypothetical protein
MTIPTKYDLYETVYLIHDPERPQMPRMITAIQYNGIVEYYLQSGQSGSWHTEQEIVKQVSYTLNQN